MFNWIRARKEKKFEKKTRRIAKRNIAMLTSEEHRKEVETVIKYYQDIESGQQFLGFIFEDPVFKKVYEGVKNGTMGKTGTMRAVI